MGLSSGSITGIFHAPFMDLQWGCNIRRFTHSRSAIGSELGTYVTYPAIIPCDVAPMTDDIVMQQVGQTELLTHVIHFQGNTDIRVRDEVVVVYAPNNIGRLGDVFIVTDVLNPSEGLSYIRCRATRGKAPEA